MISTIVSLNKEYKMDISKTSFKEYAKCERIYPLTEIYRKK